MRRLLAVVVACTLSAAPLLEAAGGAQAVASVAGTATSAGQPLANSTVQLRNLTTGQLAGTTTSSATGGFTFTGLPAGRYAVEVVNATGQIVGTSAALDVAAGAALSGVGVATAAAGAAAASAAATGLSTGTIATITAVVVGAGLGAYAIQSGGSDSTSTGAAPEPPPAPRNRAPAARAPGLYRSPRRPPARAGI